MKIVLFVISVIFVTVLILSGYPLVNLADNISPEVLGGFRVLVGLLMLYRIVRSIPALPLLHGRDKSPKVLLILQGIFSLMVIVGIFTDIAALLLFLTFVLTFRKAKYYSIEEIYFQNTLFHLPFLGLGSAYALDTYFGMTSILESSYLLNSFLISNAIIMLSAGFEKFSSPLWISGAAAQNFLGLPHLVKKMFHFIHQINNRPFWFFMTYLVMSSEFLLLFSVSHPVFFVIVSVVLIGFSANLFTILDISFIGQILCLNLLFFLVIVLFQWNDYPSIINISDFKINLATGFALVINLLSLIVIFFFKKVPLLSKLQRHLTGILCPIGVFSEIHQFGFYTFRLFYKNENTLTPVLETFDKNGFPAKYQFHYPRYFQGGMYPVTDYCLSLAKHGKKTEHRREDVIDLMYCALASIQKTNGKIVLAVKKFDKGDSIQTYQSQSWTNIAECNFDNTTPDFLVINLPPKVKVSFRNIP